MSRKLFDSTTQGIIKFFIRPDDLFALNSLELLDANEYLYRVLKNEGYQRVIFFEEAAVNNIIFTYDKLSQLSYLYPDYFKDVDIGSADSVSGFYSEVKAKMSKTDDGPKGLGKKSAKNKSSYDNIPEYGKREIKTFSKIDTLVADFSNEIQKALLAENIKTAIVFEMDVFKNLFDMEPNKARERSTALARIIKYCDSNNQNKQNIIVFTAPNRTALVELRKNPNLCCLLPWMNDVLADCKSDESFVNQVTSTLKKYNNLVSCNLSGADEIANLLLRKKIVEKDQRFDDLPFNKIYPLAEKLRGHLSMEKEVFSKDFGSYSENYNIIKTLNGILNDNSKINELMSYTERLKPKAINSVNVQSIEVERVYHNHVSYIDVDDSAEVLAEFDKLEGVEIQKAKKQVIGAVNYFKNKLDVLKEKEKNGSEIKKDNYPYYNMLFYGSPGTGKTTIANLVARLMCAKGILPTSKVVEIQAAKLGSKYVHGVNEKLFEFANKAEGGVLLIDELQAINGGHSNGNTAEEFMRGIVNVTNEYKGNICVILCGYEKEVRNILQFDDGADRRFPQKIKLESYSVDSLIQILHKLLEDNGKTLGEGVEEKIRKIINNERAVKGKKFGNVGYIKDDLIPAIDQAYSERNEKDNIYSMEDLINAFRDSDHRSVLEEQQDSVESVLAEFDNLIGEEIQKAKEEVLGAVDVYSGMKIEFDEKVKKGTKIKKDDYPYYNMLFYGSPGTGKTTIANLVARLMYVKGILPSSEVKVVQASELGSEKVHGVQDKLFEKAKEAVGGVLLIDELQSIRGAYNGGNLAEDFMKGLVSVINKYRGNMCIILCGYKNDVQEIIKKYDDGADRRFPCKVELKSYGVDTLMLILNKLLEDDEMTLGEGVEAVIRNIIQSEKALQGNRFGNVGILKDKLLFKIKIAYYKRKANDGVYTLDDVYAAYPDARQNPQQPGNIVNKIRYRKINRSEIFKLKEPYGAEAINDEKILAKATEPAILYVDTDKGNGTAFLVSPKGYAITCNHVIKDTSEIKARLRILGRQGGSDSWHKCEVINTNETLDIALIKLEGSDFPYLKLADENREIERLEDFILSGYPFGIETKDDITTFKGSIASSNLQRDENGNSRFFINCEGKCGNSGSPIISCEDGCVIGLFLGSKTHDGDNVTEEINFMRPILYFWENFLK